MRTVFLYRHAKSDWDTDVSGDHDRPLADRGVKAAHIMGKVLQGSKQVPELAIVSTALRAKQTLECSVKSGNLNCEVQHDKEIYYGSETDILSIIQRVPNQYASVMMVGHEPKTSSLCSILVGGGNFVFPTAAMARIDLNIQYWPQATGGVGGLRWLLQPGFFIKGDFSF